MKEMRRYVLIVVMILLLVLWASVMVASAGMVWSG